MHPINLPSSIQKHLKLNSEEIIYHEEFAPQLIKNQIPLEEIPLFPTIKSRLRYHGISSLFPFQNEAITNILAGKDVVIVAPTGNGKTEAFVLPIMQRIIDSSPHWGDLRQPKGVTSTLILYPTKALARDQLQKMQSLSQDAGITIAVLDGDTPASRRKAIRQQPPDILITNPDMLHLHLQNPSSGIRSLLRNVKTVVLDEIHIYTGAFGSNVHFLLQRLQRLYGQMQLIGASATIANPKDFTAKLFGRVPYVVHCQKGQKGRIHFLMVRPQRRTVSNMIVDILQSFARGKLKALVFANSHRMAEGINLMAQQNKLYSAVHRAGLPQKYRETVEIAFKNNRLDSLISTPTLELGIDIGDLSAVISLLVTYTRLIQRIGRAGRKGQDSIAVLVLRADDPISEFYSKHPSTYLADIEPAFLEPNNELVGYYQLLAASFDRPLREKEFLSYHMVVDQLKTDGLLETSTKGFLAPVYRLASQALREYSIRGTGEPIKILRGNKIIGERHMPLAAEELHPGAIYLHGGQIYRAIQFGFDGKLGNAQVEVIPKTTRIRTKSLVRAYPELLETYEKSTIYGMKVVYGKLQITQTVHGFLEKDVFTGDVLDEKSLDNPIIYSFQTRGFLFQAPKADDWIQQYLISRTRSSRLKFNDLVTGGYHALEHVLIESSNMLTGGGSQEIGGISLGDSGVIVVYDGTVGGSGVSKLLFDRLPEAFKRTQTILNQCGCDREDGCPRCTYSYQCGNNNRPLFKQGANHITDLILNGSSTKLQKEDYSTYEPLI